MLNVFPENESNDIVLPSPVIFETIPIRLSRVTYVLSHIGFKSPFVFNAVPFVVFNIFMLEKKYVTYL